MFQWDDAIVKLSIAKIILKISVEILFLRLAAINSTVRIPFCVQNGFVRLYLILRLSCK